MTSAGLPAVSSEQPVTPQPIWKRLPQTLFARLQAGALSLRVAQRTMRHRSDRTISLSKITRTTAFRLSLAYLVIFSAGSAVVLASVAWNVNGLLDEQIVQTVQAETNGLAEQYEVGGIRQLIDSVDRRTRLPGSSLYLVTNFAGETLAGNVGELPPGTIERTGLLETRYSKPNETKRKHLALARIYELPGGFRLLVGRDLEERENLRSVMTHALVISLLWLVIIGLLGGLFMALRVLRRVDAMNATARVIMATGDMSRRLPIKGTGDELDRLAANLNALIAKIATLMTGLREVSDNIAHDLRTPLTRLRNGAEEALRHASDKPDHYRDALDKVIRESDGLIGVFNALLMIARAEAGTGRESMAACDVGEVLRDVAELYEAVAEDEGVRFSAEIEPDLVVPGNRELLGQAVANMIDNAIKYGCADDKDAAWIILSGRRLPAAVEIVVADTGPGIPEQDRQRVLDRFVRLESSRTAPGSGLGLSLVSAIAQMHGGSPTLEDNEPGLRVRLTIPAERRLLGA